MSRNLFMEIPMLHKSLDLRGSAMHMRMQLIERMQ